MALSGNCMIPARGVLPAKFWSSNRSCKCSWPPRPPRPKRVSRFFLSLLQFLDPEQTASLTNLQPAVGAQAGDQVVNSSGQLFLITAVSESTFTVGEVVGTVGVQIDDERDGPDTTWSGAKLAAHFGEPHDFVQTFEAALSSQTLWRK